MKINLSWHYLFGMTIVKSYNIKLRNRRKNQVIVYLIHFEEKYKHAGHYLGSAENLAVRMADHRKGKGARLLAVLNEQGINYKVVRVWKKGGRALEKRFKHAKNHTRLCPICNPKLTIEKFRNPEEI